MGATADITELLIDLRATPGRSADMLLPPVYDALRRLAEQRLRREPADQTLQATALVHEAYLKLVDQSRVEWRDRTHFFAVAAMAMRRILVDRARKRARLRHGGDRVQVALDEARDSCQALGRASESAQVDLIDLDEALSRFASSHPDEARLVELRFFAGLELPEAAESLGISARTAERWWAFSRAWLFRSLEAEGGESERSAP
jgi:RNA polymerase sigma-70 factor, ECF subfamily